MGMALVGIFESLFSLCKSIHTSICQITAARRFEEELRPLKSFVASVTVSLEEACEAEVTKEILATLGSPLFQSNLQCNPEEAEWNVAQPDQLPAKSFATIKFENKFLQGFHSAVHGRFIEVLMCKCFIAFPSSQLTLLFEFEVTGYSLKSWLWRYSTLFYICLMWYFPGSYTLNHSLAEGFIGLHLVFDCSLGPVGMGSSAHLEWKPGHRSLYHIRLLIPNCGYCRENKWSTAGSEEICWTCVLILVVRGGISSPEPESLSYYALRSQLRVLKPVISAGRYLRGIFLGASSGTDICTGADFSFLTPSQRTEALSTRKRGLINVRNFCASTVYANKESLVLP